MHIAASSPIALTENDVDSASLTREKDVLTQKAKESGKPDNIIEKMVEGGIRKYLQEVVLEKQAFVMNPDITVAQALTEAEGSVGSPIKITAYQRFQVGEGIEKEESDFAAEVAAAVGG